MHSSSFHYLFPFAISLVAFFSRNASAKAVFAHYMVGHADEDHIHTDIEDAVTMGLDGFSLNIGDPRQSFVRESLNAMFDYTRDNHPSFKLFISMDLWAAGDTKPKQSATDFLSLVKDYKGHAAYQLAGPDNLPLVTTFADGGLNNVTWNAWRDELDNQIFFIPDFDGTEGYYDSDPGWWAHWQNTVDGLASWESAWPFRAGYGGEYPGDISPDETVLQGATNHSKPYMIPLSPLQYKNAYHTNIYRAGEINMPLRMIGILNMDLSPEYVQIVTWNDGPESHYIGNLWWEQNNDTDPSRYATQKNYPHTGWQPLLGSFITAFKEGLKASDMRPHNEEFTGAIWYKTILQSASCPWDGASEYFVPPDGFETGDDALNFAVVMPSAGYSIELYSGGEQIHRSELHAGLNYGTLPGLQPGWQRMHIVDSAGNIKRVAAGGRCVSSGCPDCVYNMNPQVVPLSDNTEDNGQCPDTRCGVVDVYVPGSIWKDDPTMQCIPPCNFILPPYQLPTNTTIAWPVLTTSVWSILEGRTITKLTSFTIPPFTTDEVRFWTITADKTDTVKTTVIPRTSVMPPPVTVTLPPDVATFAPTRPGNKTPSPPIFYSTPHIETIQPQPTITITSLPVFPTITYTSAKPITTCTSDCGFYDCSPFGCPPRDTDDDGDDDDDPDGIVLPICGIFACDGGCDSIFGCGKGCGIRGCGNQNSNDDGWCPLSACGGLGCSSGSCGSNSNEPSSTSVPCTTQTASACTTACVDASCTTVCATTRACTVTGTSTILFGTPAPAEALDFWEPALISRSDLVRSGAALTEYRDWLSQQVPISAPGATATTNNPPATTTTVAPDPTATSYVLLLSKAMTEQVSDDVQRTAWSWLVYDIPTNQKYDQCDFDNLTLHEEPYSKENSGWDSNADKLPEHPTHLEFDLKTYKDCAYESDSNEDVGSMKCDGLPSVTCKETSIHDTVWQCGDWTTVVELIECQYMY